MKRLLLIAVVASALVPAGCIPEKSNELSPDKAKLQSRLRKVEQERDGLLAVVDDQKKQIRSLQALGEGKRLEKIFHVSKIELGRYTGGVDTDGRGGHDAVKVFLRPIDRDGSTLKAAGDVKIQIYDLALPPKDNLIGEYKWSVDEISKYWSGGFMTYHFSFVCPWKEGTEPRHKKLTVRAEFVDYLTGRSFTAQKLCEVRLKLLATTSTKPAK